MGAEKSIERTVKVLNKYGIHARPAALLVKAAGQYESEIYLEKDGNEVSCKSIMGLMTIEGFPGCSLRISICGSDADAAMEEIVGLFDNKFGED